MLGLGLSIPEVAMRIQRGGPVVELVTLTTGGVTHSFITINGVALSQFHTVMIQMNDFSTTNVGTTTGSKIKYLLSEDGGATYLTGASDYTQTAYGITEYAVANQAFLLIGDENIGDMEARDSFAIFTSMDAVAPTNVVIQENDFTTAVSDDPRRREGRCNTIAAHNAIRLLLDWTSGTAITINGGTAYIAGFR